MVIPFIHRLVRRNLTSQGIASKRVSIAGTSIHYYEACPEHPRDTLVLVHGLGTSTSTWTHILPDLAREYHVIAPDLPGFGFSIPKDGFPVYSIDEYVAVLEQFLDNTLSGEFVLLGHSLGGWITMKYALRNPQRVNQLVLVNTAGIYYQGSEQLVDLFDIRSTKDTNRLLDRIWKRYPWYFRLLTPFVFEDLVRRKVPQIVKAIQKGDFLNADLSRFHMPVSVIWGKGDQLLSSETLTILSECLPARTIHIIEQSGHVPQLEAPREFLTIVRKILEDRVL
ncbi:MAG: alpha/beta fold hydrolase [Bacteroidota bacterium]